jgi:hypothetical protein
VPMILGLASLAVFPGTIVVLSSILRVSSGT